MRNALNKLELAYNLGLKTDLRESEITIDNVRESSTVKILRYDRDGDDHYDTLSAFHKSLRGSDENASLHYLARLIKAGDIQGITRRILCVASEDVGLANPNAVVIAKSCVDSSLQLGFPEAKLPLAQAVIYLARSPKSNSVMEAIDKALGDLDMIDVGNVPIHLKDAHYGGATELGRGRGYKYPHEYENNYINQQYLPDNIKNKIYYRAGNNKNEMSFEIYWENIKQGKNKK